MDVKLLLGFLTGIVVTMLTGYFNLRNTALQHLMNEKEKYYTQFIHYLFKKGTGDIESVKGFFDRISYMCLLAEKETVNEIFDYVDYLDSAGPETLIGEKLVEHDAKLVKLVNILRDDYRKTKIKSYLFCKNKHHLDQAKIYSIITQVDEKAATQYFR